MADLIPERNTNNVPFEHVVKVVTLSELAERSRIGILINRKANLLKMKVATK